MPCWCPDTKGECGLPRITWIKARCSTPVGGTIRCRHLEVVHIITHEPEGPFGAKEIGEGFILSTPEATAKAIHDATGVWIKNLPITPEKIIMP